MAPYRRSAAAFLAALVVASGLALLVDDEGWDTAFGLVAGASTVLLAACLVGIALERRRRRAEHDAAALDRLEPLRAARRDGA